MASFNELREKLKDTLNAVADTTKDFASKTADKAKDAARIAKLSVEINGVKDTIKKAYLEIGKLYYEMHRDDPDGFFAQLCDEVTVANANIAAKEAEIAELKAGNEAEADIEVEIVEEEEACCCGEEAPAEEPCCCCEEAPAEEPCCCGEEAPAEEPCCCECAEKED